MPSARRTDRVGQHRTTFDKNRKKILMTQDICGICGKVVDKSLKRPEPLAPEVDHIIPIAKGGHPSAMDNLQLVHACCNRTKSDKVFLGQTTGEVATNQNLRWSMDWLSF